MHLVEYSNDDLPGSTAILTGAIGDFGEAVSVYPNGTVDPAHNSEYNFALTQGSFRITWRPSTRTSAPPTSTSPRTPGRARATSALQGRARPWPAQAQACTRGQW